MRRTSRTISAPIYSIALQLMLAIEDQFAGVEITDDDVEQIQVVGDLLRHLNIKLRRQPSRPREQL